MQAMLLAASVVAADGRTAAPSSPQRAQAARMLAVAPPTPVESAEQLLDFGERMYPGYFPTREVTQTLAPFRYRHYPTTGIYLGVVTVPGLGYVEGGVYVMGGSLGANPLYVGPLTSFITPLSSTSQALVAGWDVTMAVLPAGQLDYASTEPTWRRAGGDPVAGGSFRRLAPAAVAAIDVDRQSALAVGDDGRVYGWGVNTNGSLGGTLGNENVAVPRALGGVEGARAVLATSTRSLALLQDGTVRYWPGTLSFGAGGAVSAPRAFEGLTQVRRLVAGSMDVQGYRQTPLAIRADGSVWALTWDLSMAGTTQTYTGRATPHLGLTDIDHIACNAHCLALRTDGTVLAWGSNGSGELGLGTEGSAQLTPTPVPGLSGVRAVGAMLGASVALLRDGTVWSWGAPGRNGQGGTANVAAPKLLASGPYAAMAVGPLHAILRRHDGSTDVWGDNFAGQLGFADTATRLTPVTSPGLTFR